jgi:sRNA-binding protein
MGPHPAKRHTIHLPTLAARPKPPPTVPKPPAPAPPVDAKAAAAKQRKLKRARLEALAWLEGAYPRLFDDPVVRPLAVGLGKTITREALAAGLKRQAIAAALHGWTCSRRYLMALVADGAARHGLDGAPVEPVSDDHRAQAAKLLEERARILKEEAHG